MDPLTPVDAGFHPGGYEILSPDTQPALLRPSRKPRRVFWLSLILALTLALAATLSFRTSPYDIVHPGPTLDVTRAIDPSAPNRPSADAGAFFATTIAVERASWGAYVWALVTDRTVAEHAPAPFAAASAPITEMSATKSDAALAAAGFVAADPETLVTAKGVLVVDVATGSPAARAGLRPYDMIVAVDGNHVGTLEEFALAASSVHSGTAVLSVNRRGQSLSLTIPTAEGPIGASAQTTAAVRYDIETEDISGSSAGLMFALGYLDALYPGDLTGGLRVAGTGTIAPDGGVGSIIGVDLKIRSAANVDADVFFAPAWSAPSLEARTAAPRIEVVTVEKLSDAVAWLCSHGAVDGACG